MKKIYFLSVLLSFAFLPNGYSQHAFLEQDVIDALINADENDLLPIMIQMDDMVDVKALNQNFKTNGTPVDKRAQIVMELLKNKANSTQAAVISYITSSGMAYENIQQLWISNIISLKASPELITHLANLESVGRIALDMPQFSLEQPEKGTGSAEKSVGGVEPGIVAIGSPEMWAMGYTGQSRLALTFDTGCWPDHPSFKNRYLVNRMPLESTWFGYDSPVPVDKGNSHGTHVSGTILGLDTATADTIGSAFNAYLIVTDPIVTNLAYVKSLSEILLGYEWAMNPDGDETTSSDIPDVINNSWGRDNTVEDQDWTVCPELFAPGMAAVEAAGIANVFSAGNEGPNPETIGVPHNLNEGLVNSLTVAAVNGNLANLPIADFSSRGPSLCGGEGSLLIKPEVSAPGVNVRSSVANGGYDIFSGTSMAAPHVSGAVLLLKEAFPYLSGEDILLALYYSAMDLGAPGEDNTFGMGMINVKAAYDYLAENNEPVPPAVHNTDIELVSILSPSESIGCSQPDEDISVAPLVLVRNNGINDVTGIEIHYTINGGVELVYTDSEITIGAGSDTQILLPVIEVTTTGNQELHAWITPLDGEFDTFNNHNVYRWIQLPQVSLSADMTFSEDFEDGINTDMWTIQNLDGNITWDTLSVLQANGEVGIAAWMDFRNYTEIASQKDDLFSPMLYLIVTDLNFSTIHLDFDLFYRKKSNNDFTKDTLAIFLNQFCGSIDETYSEVFRQGGDSLYTIAEGSSSLLPQDVSEWRHVSLSIPYDSEISPYFYFVFQGINRRGNNLLIDNVNISLNHNVGIAERKAPEIKLYPNPTNTSFTLVSEGIVNAQTMEIFDVFGRKISDYKINSSTQFDVSSLSKGIYLVRVYWKDGMTSAVPLVIQ